jgi:hypothetical protein
MLNLDQPLENQRGQEVVILDRNFILGGISLLLVKVRGDYEDVIGLYNHDGSPSLLSPARSYQVIRNREVAAEP